MILDHVTCLMCGTTIHTDLKQKLNLAARRMCCGPAACYHTCWP
jgi:hypothetical protein